MSRVSESVIVVFTKPWTDHGRYKIGTRKVTGMNGMMATTHRYIIPRSMIEAAIKDGGEVQEG